MAERYSTETMGETAENVAERYGVSREDQDAFALRSHQRAVAAQEEGRFAEQLIPVDAPGGEARRDRHRRWPTRARERTRRSSGSAPCGPPSATAAR